MRIVFVESLQCMFITGWQDSDEGHDALSRVIGPDAEGFSPIFASLLYG